MVGAIVRLENLGLSAVTDRTGQFRISGVPTGSYSVVADYLDFQPETKSVTVSEGAEAQVDFSLSSGMIVLAEIRVESVREGQSRAINQQRSADSLRNIISSDTIGNLPDRTVGEALGRLPGVNVVDDSYASVRGVAAEHNAVTLDGQRLMASNDIYSTNVQDDTRAVDLSLIPAEIVGGIEVLKVLTPDKDADSLGGTINLVTRSAFELKNRSINGKLEYIVNNYGDKAGWAGSFSYMDVLNDAGTLGLSTTLTYRNEDKAWDSYEITYYDADAIPVGNSGSGTAGSIAAVGDEGIQEFDVRHNFEENTKIGATANLDWKVSDSTELHFRTFLEHGKRDGGRYRNRARALSRWNADSTADLQSGNQIRFVNLYEDGTRTQDLLRLGIDGMTQLGDGQLDYAITYGRAEQEADRERYVFEYATNAVRRAYSWTMDRTDPQLPVFTMTNIASGANGLYDNLADRRLTLVRFHNAEEDETDLTGKVDYSIPQTLGNRTIRWKVGIKSQNKDRSSRPIIDDYTPPSSAVPTFSQFTVTSEPRDVLNGSMESMGPYVSLDEVMASFRANQSAYTKATAGETLVLQARTYDASEDIFASYAMASTEVGKLEIIGGVRWEHTKTGYTWIADPDGPSRGGNSYDDLYPSLLFNYRLTPNLVGRLSWTNTLSRPSYGDLVPYSVNEDTQSESGNGGVEPSDYPETVQIFLGNADLVAQQSQNFDLSLEYYIKPAGVLSVALFRKELSDVIYRSQWKDPDDAFTIYFQERNGGKGTTDGIEISWQQAFTFLPGPLDGLGINANATFIDGSSVLQELVPGTTDTYRSYKVDFLPEQPETVYNVQLWWEKYGFTARVALNYVDEFVRTSGGLTSYSVNNEASRWDASVSYRLNENFIIYLEAKNLTEEVTAWYATRSSRPEDYDFRGRTFNGGVKFRF
ncbi:MAG: TonB-dependent receptor [Opitutaceae bacterium]|nr:TonB-dependent receptor [Opitutaceae bacterium]